MSEDTCPDKKKCSGIHGMTEETVWPSANDRSLAWIGGEVKLLLSKGCPRGYEKDDCCDLSGYHYRRNDEKVTLND